MQTLNTSQKVAVKRIIDAYNDGEVMCALYGSPGVGKSYTVGRLVKYLIKQGRKIVICAPTHKALKVAMSGIDLSIRREDVGKKISPDSSIVSSLTVAKLLGQRPDRQESGRTIFTEGDVEILIGDILIIDEISMVCNEELGLIYKYCEAESIKILVVGDKHQLPPVEAEAVDLDSLPNINILTEPVRNTSAEFVEMINNVKVKGVAGIYEVEDVAIKVHDTEQTFLDNLVPLPTTIDAHTESKLNVFISYRNEDVRRVQELACQKLYNHGRDEIRVGEIVVSIDQSSDAIKNFEYVKIVSISTIADDELGWRTALLSERGRTQTLYYNPNAYEPNSPYLNELTRLENLAKELQAEKYNAGKNWRKEGARTAAWRAYYEHKTCILSFFHPFSLTSHKAQGSSFNDVYIDRNHFTGFDKSAIYVAASRNKGKLFYQ